MKRLLFHRFGSKNWPTQTHIHIHIRSNTRVDLSVISYYVIVVHIRRKVAGKLLMISLRIETTNFGVSVNMVEAGERPRQVAKYTR